MFYVGQRVVCVDAEPHHRYVTGLYNKVVGGLDGLETGRVYTIRAVGKWHPEAAEMVWLQEIVRPIDSDAAEMFGEPGFAAPRFRPVAERKTDISIFERMLNPAKKAAETVGFLAFMWGVAVVVQFAQFWGLV